MAAAVTYARSRGVVVLGSAGNDGENAPFYPASFPGVIGVAATDLSNKPYSWSNRGRWFELAAPGCFHTTTARRGYTSFCGTSASTPLVAGIVGLIRSARPDLPGYMIERALLGSAKKYGYVSHGIPNAGKAIDVARGMKAPPPPNATHAWVEKYGVVTIEAERANERIGRSSIDWIDGAVKPGFVGAGYVAAWADKGLFMGTNYAATSAELRYHVHFTKPGIYSIWIRTWAPDAGGDSVHVGVDGKELKATDRMTTGVHGKWGWTRSTMDGTVAKIAIAKPGIRTINVWAREDGFRFDRIVISLGPVPEGVGPPESATIGIPKR
jgi:subtilisin family serine protease